MKCAKCNTEHCTCDDFESRLDSVPNFIYRRCAKCKKHYTRCKCVEPVWETAGRRTPMFPNMIRDNNEDAN